MLRQGAIHAQAVRRPIQGGNVEQAGQLLHARRLLYGRGQRDLRRQTISDLHESPSAAKRSRSAVCSASSLHWMRTANFSSSMSD